MAFRLTYCRRLTPGPCGEFAIQCPKTKWVYPQPKPKPKPKKKPSQTDTERYNWIKGKLGLEKTPTVADLKKALKERKIKLGGRATKSQLAEILLVKSSSLDCWCQGFVVIKM